MCIRDSLKRTPETRHIPVHVISADDQKGLGLSIGAVGFTHKPVEREVVVSTLQGVKTFADLEMADDFAGVITRPAAELPDAVVIEASAVPVAELIDQLVRRAGHAH